MEKDCWHFLGSKDRFGYGRLYGIGAHRISWEIHRGPIPNGLFVCHHCDNPPCINPAHLFLGTALDNQRDKVRKGRLRYGHVPGELCGHAILTNKQVLEMRASYVPGVVTIRMLAKRYGVAYGTANHILHFGTWKHLRSCGKAEE